MCEATAGASTYAPVHRGVHQGISPPNAHGRKTAMRTCAARDKQHILLRLRLSCFSRLILGSAIITLVSLRGAEQRCKRPSRCTTQPCQHNPTKAIWTPVVTTIHPRWTSTHSQDPGRVARAPKGPELRRSLAIRPCPAVVATRGGMLPRAPRSSWLMAGALLAAEPCHGAD